MAYAAVISVQDTFIRHDPCISMASSSLKVLQSAYDELDDLPNVLNGMDHCKSITTRKKLDDLDQEIREAAFELEDLLEFALYDLFLSLSEESIEHETCSMKCDKEKVKSVAERVRDLKEEYAAELKKKPSRQENRDYAVSSASTYDSDGKMLNIFGLSDREITGLKRAFMNKSFPLQIVSLVAEGATTRTILAKLLCERANPHDSFERGAILRIGEGYELKDVLINVLSQIDDDYADQKSVISKEEEEDNNYEKLLGERLYSCLQGRRYYLCIVLDHIPIWEWNLLRSSFPKELKGSRVFLITSPMEVAKFADSDKVYELNFQIKDETWDLIRKVDPISYYKRRDAERLAKIQLFLSESYGEISEDQDDDFSTSDLPETIEKIFQIFDHVEETMYDDFSNNFLGLYQCCPDILSLIGMAGIGKTTLARRIFEDPTILCHFDHRVWVTLGPNYQSENILADIFAHIDSNIDITQLLKREKILPSGLSKKAWDRRNLIVLDDMCSTDPIEYLGRLNGNIRGKILLTTRLQEVTELIKENSRLGSGYKQKVYQMQLLTKEESWDFLSEKVFAEKSCPRELEQAGKMIAEECEGLPLMIATVASILSETERTTEFWTKVAKKQTSVFEDAYDMVSENLYPTYECLPQSMKPYFLYMAVFPLRYKVPTSKFIKLMKFEGIDDCYIYHPKECLRNLVSKSLLLKRKMSSQFGIKTSSLHSVYWHLCRNEARKTKFFHVLVRWSDGLEESMKSQRRFCIQNNVLFGMKDVYNSMASNSIVRSLLCTGPSHPYQVPLCLGSRLLRLLDALTLRFYEFPIEVVHLLLLRYIGITYDGKLPPSISKLWNLECLIVRRHLHTKLLGAPLYLPNEIWDMQKLKHLQVMGSHLPYPCDAELPKLKTLLEVSPQSVMEGVLLGTPELKKLGIRIELAPDASEPMFIFDHLEHVSDSLESLKCAVVNPELTRSRVVAPPPLALSSLKKLEKLSLSGFGYPWECMRTIAGLPWLKVLKLQCYAFQGPEWVIHEGEFRWLEYLLVEDSDVEYVKRCDDDGRFHRLRRLILRHCYKLKEFPCRSREGELELEIVDCATSASKNIQGVSRLRSSWEE